MKAYRHADGAISLFRPSFNAARLRRSAERMAIPAIEEAAFVDALVRFVDRERQHVPARPGSLYLRPTIFASEAAIGVRAGNEYEFFVIAMPVESYFSSSAGTPAALEIFVSESIARATPGGTGAVKAGANYAVTLKVIDEAKKLGCSQVLFLDSGGRRLIEEAGGMNLFIVRGSRLMTPPLSGTILGGVTRDSLLTLAPSLGLEAAEEPVSIDTLVEDLRTGEVSEVFLCGTAAVVASVGSLRFESGSIASVGAAGSTPIADKLRDRLMGIQFGSYPDPHHWVVPVR
jgi:branched-chain amino acid aminotransferase